MSREIKFRAWINVPNAGDMLHNIDLEDLWQSGRAYEDYGTSRFEAETISGVTWTFKDLIFMQYTGLKDCKWQEIYEGDILRVENSSLYPVIYGKGCFCIEDHEDGRVALEDFGMYLVEVVGNIHEHQYLLKLP